MPNTNLRENNEIVRSSNGKIEGKNSYIKKMLKLASGYYNFDRFRNSAMYCENYMIHIQKKSCLSLLKEVPKKDQTSYWS